MFFLAWRNLSQSRTQFILGVGGVALALLLMLALDALLAGSEEDLVAYIQQSEADIFVSQEGVRNLHMAASAITSRDMVLASHAEGVASASPILYTTGVIETGQADILSYIIGFDPDKPLGGPQRVVAGTTRLGREETIIDEAVARSQGLGLGDERRMMFMGLLWLIPLIFVGLLIAYLSGWRPDGSLQPPQRKDRSSLEILKDRYARGEISREEYQEMRRDLAS